MLHLLQHRCRGRARRQEAQGGRPCSFGAWSPVLVQQGLQARLSAWSSCCVLCLAPTHALTLFLLAQGGPIQPLPRHRILCHTPPPWVPDAGEAPTAAPAATDLPARSQRHCCCCSLLTLSQMCRSTWTTPQTSATSCPPMCPSSKAPWWSPSAWECTLAGEERSVLARMWPSLEPGQLVRPAQQCPSPGTSAWGPAVEQPERPFQPAGFSFVPAITARRPAPTHAPCSRQHCAAFPHKLAAGYAEQRGQRQSLHCAVSACSRRESPRP